MTTAALDYDSIVVGSGFGGSVAALRLAESGRRVLVLEMGRRVSADDMARAAASPRHLLWLPALGMRGPLRQAVLRHVIALTGVAVGGGSVVYAAVSLRPREGFWGHPAWQALGEDWPTALAPHFDTAERMLGVRVNPDTGRQDVWLREAAALLGVAESAGATPQAIDFDGCTRCGLCLSGCQPGAKNSLDRTYLRRAEAAGAQVRERSKVVRVEPLGAPGSDRGYRVLLVDPLAPPNRRAASQQAVTAREVVLAAGVLGTVELLLACRDRWGSLPDLSPALGEGVLTNSEAFGGILQPRQELADGLDVRTDGAAISTDFWVDGQTHVTNNRLPDSYALNRFLMAPLVDGSTRGGLARRTVAEMLRHPGRTADSMRRRGWSARATMLTVMQHDEPTAGQDSPTLTLRYRRTPVGWLLGSAVPVGGRAPATSLPQADRATRAVAAASGGTPFGSLGAVLGVGATAHILGGARLGTDPATSVLDPTHQVWGHPGLYVLDGSALPANVGVNPSLTITALAERAMAALTG